MVFVNPLVSSFFNLLDVIIVFLMAVFYCQRDSSMRSFTAKEFNLVIGFYLGTALWGCIVWIVFLAIEVWFLDTITMSALVTLSSLSATVLPACVRCAFLLYLSRKDFFTKKQKNILSTFCVIVMFLNAYRAIGDGLSLSWIGGLFALLVPICAICGFLVPRGEKKNAWYYFVAFGWPLYVSLILLALLAGLVYLCCELMFGGKSSAPKQGKKYEVVDGGVTYIIEETNNGTYFDDCNREWFTDDNGTSFYRKD